MYARQAEKVGVLGLIGFILTFVGLTFLAGALIFLSVLVIPFLAGRGMDSFVDPKGPCEIHFLMWEVVGSPRFCGRAGSRPGHRFPAPGGSRRTRTDTRMRQFEFRRTSAEPPGHARTRPQDGSGP
jgi:hypothetical protein